MVSLFICKEIKWVFEKVLKKKRRGRKKREKMKKRGEIEKKKEKNEKMKKKKWEWIEREMSSKKKKSKGYSVKRLVTKVIHRSVILVVLFDMEWFGMFWFVFWICQLLLSRYSSVFWLKSSSTAFYSFNLGGVRSLSLLRKENWSVLFFWSSYVTG